MKPIEILLRNKIDKYNLTKHYNVSKMTKAQKIALYMQFSGLEHFTYVADEINPDNVGNIGAMEDFRSFARKFLKDKDFQGDCDNFADTLIDAFGTKDFVDETKNKKYKTLRMVEDRDLVRMVTPNHYIGGVIDRELNDVWVFENTGFQYLPKALEDPNNFMAIQESSHKFRLKNGFIKPMVYRLSELQAGLIIPEVRGKRLVIPARVKEYKMTEFIPHIYPKGSRWFTSHEDYPMLKDFVEDRSENVPPAEAFNNRHFRYGFTKNWEAKLKFHIGVFNIDANFDSNKSKGEQLEASVKVGNFEIGSIKASQEKYYEPKALESLSDKQWVFLKNVAKLINYAESLGYKLTGGELYRTKYQQREYIRLGRSKTMNSKHLKRLAIDLNCFVDGSLTYSKEAIQPLGDFWESLDIRNEWGGNWKTFHDTPHFQMREEDR